MDKTEKKKIRLVASDLDGTLFDDKKEIMPFTREMIDRLLAKGIYFVPATGRPVGSVTDNVAGIPGLQYMICSNGASLYSLPDKKRIYEKILTQESVHIMRSIPREAGIAMEAFISGEPFAQKEYYDDPAAFGATEYGVTYIKKTRKPVEDWETFLLEHEAELDSVSFVGKDHQALAALRERIEAEVPDVYAIWSFTHLLEVGNAGAGKGETLLQLLHMLGISAEEAMAFGDAENDVTMLQSVRYGIAMGNAFDIVKEAAYDVAGTNNEEGIGRYLEKYLEL